MLTICNMLQQCRGRGICRNLLANEKAAPYFIHLGKCQQASSASARARALNNFMMHHHLTTMCASSIIHKNNKYSTCLPFLFSASAKLPDKAGVSSVAEKKNDMVTMVIFC